MIMIKVFKVADIHRLIKQVSNEEITYSRMVEIMNEMSNKAHSESQKSDSLPNVVLRSEQLPCGYCGKPLKDHIKPEYSCP